MRRKNKKEEQKKLQTNTTVANEQKFEFFTLLPKEIQFEVFTHLNHHKDFSSLRLADKHSYFLLGGFFNSHLIPKFLYNLPIEQGFKITRFFKIAKEALANSKNHFYDLHFDFNAFSETSSMSTPSISVEDLSFYLFVKSPFKWVQKKDSVVFHNHYDLNKCVSYYDKNQALISPHFLQNIKVMNAFLNYYNSANTLGRALERYKKLYSCIKDRSIDNNLILNLSKICLQYKSFKIVSDPSLEINYALFFKEMNLQYSNFFMSSFEGINFNESNLKNSFFKNAMLLNTTFEKANLSNVDLSDTEMTSVDFTHANLTNSNFSCSILKAVNLSNADLTGATLIDIQLNDCDLEKVIWTDTTFLSEKDFTNEIAFTIAVKKLYRDLNFESSNESDNRKKQYMDLTIAISKNIINFLHNSNKDADSILLFLQKALKSDIFHIAKTNKIKNTIKSIFDHPPITGNSLLKDYRKFIKNPSNVTPEIQGMLTAKNPNNSVRK